MDDLEQKVKERFLDRLDEDWGLYEPSSVRFSRKGATR
jgi:hypothetical protein